MSPDVIALIESGKFDGNSQSLGLQNVFYRLQNEYQSRFTVNVQSAPDGGTCIRLNLVMQSEEEHLEIPPLDLKTTLAPGIGNQINLQSIETSGVVPVPQANNELGFSQSLLTPI
jgi:hypothetical protein